jgi:hypothetical protein
MFPFTDVMDFLADELARLRARRPAAALRLPCTSQRLLFGHANSSKPPGERNWSAIFQLPAPNLISVPTPNVFGCSRSRSSA